MAKRKLVILALVGLVTAACLNSGRWLVINQPKKADVILVLAGETYMRPQMALALLRQGYAPKIVMDVPAREVIYQWSTPELAERWARTLPDGNAISICPIYGLSTKEEAHEAQACLARMGNVHQVLIVTSDFHTRRALSVFQHEISTMQFSVAAAQNDSQFGVLWWRQREWAKTSLYEWMRLVWWEVVDRWR
jgi:hypothetical protein